MQGEAAKMHLMFSFNPTFNLGFGKQAADKPKDAIKPKGPLPIQPGVGPFQIEIGDPALLLMLTAIVLLSSAVLVYAARH